VKAVSVQFSAAEMKRLESQAFVRGCDVPLFIRDAVHLLTERVERPERSKRVGG